MANDNFQHAWKVRFAVSVIMLALAFLGMIVTDLKSEGAWHYWRIMTPVYAVLSLGLSLYMHHRKLRSAAFTIWHEIVHWAGLLLAVYLVSNLVQMGFMSRYMAGVQVLLLLALATFLAGVYIEVTFIVVGLVLGLLVAGIGFLNQYVYSILLPVVIVAILVILFIIHKIKSKKNPA